MKLKSLLVLLMLGHLACAQSGKRIQVAGTKCSLIPPAGFTTATTFSGFQEKASGASIMINEMPAPYADILKGFTEDALKTRGMTLTGKSSIQRSDSEMTLLRVTQVANDITYMKQILILGYAAGTVLVNGTYPAAAKEMDSLIQEALLTTVYDSAQQLNLEATVPFQIDVTRTALKPARYISGSLLYTVDGQIPSALPSFVVGSSFSRMDITSRLTFTKERLKNLPGGENSTIQSVVEINIDQMQGYEIVAQKAIKDAAPELVYLVMLFSNQGEYYVMAGQAADNFDKNTQLFRAIAATFKRKYRNYSE
ncbi:MAG: hypothetical protein PHD73_06935 [Sediminibacterium sp.]|nr:hypothetical protein [Sediminibacterium sp.]